MTIIYDLPQLWDTKSTATVELAALVVGTALAPYTGLDPAASFEAVFGTVHVRFTKTLQYHALAKWGVIRFQNAEVIGLALVVHELWHLFCAKAKNKPIKDLAWLDTSAGRLWPGMHPPTLAGYNDTEDKVNLLADWSMGMLAQNGFGRGLRDEIVLCIPSWCALAMGVSNVTV
jgi:hypothetical protein